MGRAATLYDPNALIPFSKPFVTEHELSNLQRVLESDHAHGDGAFTRSASDRLRAITGVDNVLLTTSCTHALEMACQLLNIGPGDHTVHRWHLTMENIRDLVLDCMPHLLR